MPYDPYASRVPRPHRSVLRALLSVIVLVVVVVLVAVLVFAVTHRSTAGHVKDEAAQVGRGGDSFPGADEDYFHDMDGGLKLNVDQVKGRNNWIVWTGGNDRLWDLLTKKSFGSLDLLKTISSHPSLKASRDNRWGYLGLVNEPCFTKATAPNPARYGLWLDVRDSNCPGDPFENAAKYKGVEIGARGKDIDAGSYYGYATGIVGLRIFPNPAFDAEAKKHWDPARYYTDPSYYNDRNLVRPYRVGMSCGFCHVGPNPLHTPADPNNPQWADLSSMVGAQYFWIDRIFAWDGDQSSFVFQLFHTSRPGALDTSLISTDNINNPRTMNAVYGLNARLAQARKWGQEKLAGGGLDNKQFNDYVPADNPLAAFYQKPDLVYVPHILKDGADSVGALGALNRVYLNIGMFSEEWLQHFNALVGGKKTTPIPIEAARKNSSYWVANEMQTVDLAKFMLVSTDPHHLADAPGGPAYLTKDQAVLTHGKEVFAERCARCHSSKLPDDSPEAVSLQGCAGKDYLNCWNRYWQWTKTDDFRSRMRAIVLRDDFLKDNYLSTDARVPVTLLRTNACSPLATNGLGGNIWDNFTSQSYKDLPAVGDIQVQDPYTAAVSTYAMPGGGRGYTRPPSLISLWSTAPYLLNNSVGKFNSSPSVEARMDSFNDSIEKMLWPERREKDELLPDKLEGKVDRTTERSYLRAGAGYLPEIVSNHIQFWHAFFPWIINSDPDHPEKEGVVIGPIPKGTPVNLLANVNLMSDSTDSWERFKHNYQVLGLIKEIKKDLVQLGPNPTDDQVRAIFANAEPKLIGLSKCSDFVVNRGHYFGTDRLGEEPGLSDTDKKALIEFLKTF